MDWGWSFARRTHNEWECIVLANNDEEGLLKSYPGTPTVEMYNRVPKNIIMLWWFHLDAYLEIGTICGMVFLIWITELHFNMRTLLLGFHSSFFCWCIKQHTAVWQGGCYHFPIEMLHRLWWQPIILITLIFTQCNARTCFQSICEVHDVWTFHSSNILFLFKW